MRVLQRLAILLLALGLAPHGARAAEPLRNEELIEKSGIGGQVRAYIAEVEKLGQETAWAPKRLEKLFENLRATVVEEFTAENVFSVIDRGLQEQLTEEDKSFLLAHYNSPLGRRIAELELNASQPGADAGIEAVAQELITDPDKYADRRALYLKIDEASGANLLVLPPHMTLPMLATPALLWMSMKDLDAAATRALLEQHRAEQEKQIADAMALAAYTYRDLPKEDLETYLAFLNSSPAKKFNLTLQGLFMDSVFSGFADFGNWHKKYLAPK